MSFDELRAKVRGWFDRDWAAEARQQRTEEAAGRARAEANMVATKEPKSTTVDLRANESQVSNESLGSNVDSTRTLDLGHTTAIDLGQTVAIDLGGEGKVARPKKTKIKEVKGATQTSEQTSLFVRVPY